MPQFTALPPVPAKHSDLIHHFHRRQSVSIPELVKPYNEHDAVVRKIFAQEPEHPAIVDNHLNVVPLYDGGATDLRIRARDLTSESDDLKEKYLLPLPDNQRRPNGAPAVVSTLNEFQKNFDLFSERSLVDLDWSNVVVAGSAVTTCLLPLPDECKGSKRAARRFYHDQFAPASDVDLFLYGVTEEQAIEKIKQIETRIRDSLLTETTTIRTKHTLTIASQYPTRHVQIVLRLYRSIAEILTGFDVDCACAAYDGSQVYLAPRAVGAFITQTNQIDLSRRSPSYENRLSKYSRRGFEVFWSELDRTRIDPTVFERGFARPTGLARLLVLEKLPNPSDREAYLNQRREERGRPEAPDSHLFKKLKGNLKEAWEDEAPEWEDENVSGYHTFTIPYGERFHARKIEKLLYARDLLLNAEWNKPKDREVNLHRHPAFFGNFDDVIHDCCGDCPVPTTAEEKQVAQEESKRFVSGKISFLRDDPGRQEIGSFNPTTETDWTEMGYVSNAESLCRAIAGHDLEGVKQWLSQDKNDVNCRDHTGRTPLHLATLTSTPEIVQCLVDQGARLIARLVDGRTSLHIAAARGSVEIVRILLTKSESNEEAEARKEDVNEQEEDGELVTRSSDSNMEDIQNSDAESSDQPIAEDCSFTTESFVDINRDEIPVAVPNDADLGPDIYDIDAASWDSHAAPLHCAIIKGHETVVEELVSSFGATVKQPLKLLGDASYHQTAIIPLALAVLLPLENSKTMTAKLLQLGASPAQADLQRMTPLHYVALSKRYGLLDLYVHYNQPAVKRAINTLSVEDSHYALTHSPLMTAVRQRHVIGASKLLEAGASATCAYSQYVKCADMDSSDELLQSFERMIPQPVALAVAEDLPSLAIDLVNRGANPNTLSRDGTTALHLSHTRGYVWGTSLLDCVRNKLKSCRGYGSNPLKRKRSMPFGDDSVYLEGLHEGTYHYWSAKAQLVDARVRVENREKQDQEQRERTASLPGQAEKKAAIKALIPEFEKLEAELLARGAKTFDELHPDITERPMLYHNGPRKEGFSLSCSFKAPDLTEARKEGYFRLFEAAWQGDTKTVEAVALFDWGPENENPPLEIGIKDTRDYTPFAIAVLRGHLETARSVFAILLAQYKPRGTTPSSDDGSSDALELESDATDDQSAVDDAGRPTTEVQSHISPMTVLNSEYPINGFLGVNRQSKEDMKYLLDFAIWKDDVDLLALLLGLGQEATVQLPDQSGEIYTVQQPQFELAMRLGRTRCLEELIKRAGVGLPLKKLAQKSGTEVHEKPKFYQGLSIHGKKRTDWASAARKRPMTKLMDRDSPLILAAREGNLDAVEWFLGDTPGRCYIEFAKAHSHDRRLERIARSEKGMEQSILDWLTSRHHLVLHAAILCKNHEGAGPLIEYLVQKVPHCLEFKSLLGYTPLSAAFYLGRYTFAKILIAAGANQTVRDHAGNNLLHLLFYRLPYVAGSKLDTLRGMLELIDPLLMRSMLVERSSLEPGSLTPVAMWIKEAFHHDPYTKSADDKVRAMCFVLELTGSIDRSYLEARDGAGNTIAHDAVRYKIPGLVEFLFEKHPDLLRIENSTGSTPLELAEDVWISSIPWNYPFRSYHIPLNDIREEPALVNTSPEVFARNELGKRDRTSKEKKVYDVCSANAHDIGLQERRLVTLFDANKIAKRLSRKTVPGWRYPYNHPENQPRDEVTGWLLERRC